MTRVSTIATPAAATISNSVRQAPLHRSSPAVALGLALVMTLATLSGIDQLAQPESVDALWAQPASTAVRG